MLCNHLLLLLLLLLLDAGPQASTNSQAGRLDDLKYDLTERSSAPLPGIRNRQQQQLQQPVSNHHVQDNLLLPRAMMGNQRAAAAAGYLSSPASQYGQQRSSVSGEMLGLLLSAMLQALW